MWFKQIMFQLFNMKTSFLGMSSWNVYWYLSLTHRMVDVLNQMRNNLCNHKYLKDGIFPHHISFRLWCLFIFRGAYTPATSFKVWLLYVLPHSLLLIKINIKTTLNKCAYVYMCMYMCVCGCICMYICVCVVVYACIYASSINRRSLNHRTIYTNHKKLRILLQYIWPPFLTLEWHTIV